MSRFSRLSRACTLANFRLLECIAEADSIGPLVMRIACKACFGVPLIPTKQALGITKNLFLRAAKENEPGSVGGVF